MILPLSDRPGRPLGKPFFTALIGTYNQGRFVEDAIRSVLEQDFPPSEVEVLVVDDGSTDDTQARVKKFDGRVRYIRKENGGQASVFNLGFREARGRVIALLDGDDVWLPRKLRRVAEEFEKHPEAGLVCHPYLYWSPEENLCEPERNFFAMSGNIWESRSRILRYGCFGTSGLVLRAEVAERMSPVPESLFIYADTFLVYLAPFLTSIVAINEHLAKYRHHGANNTAFSANDTGKIWRRWDYYRQSVEAVREHLQNMGVSLDSPNHRAYFERHHLVIQEFRFHFTAPGRREFYRHLRSHNKLYGPLWTARYRAFRQAMALAGFFLGYAQFEGFRTAYRNDRGLLKLREAWAPTRTGSQSPAPDAQFYETV